MLLFPGVFTSEMYSYMLYLCRYYDSGLMELATLGNYGRVSVTHSYDGATSITTAATGGRLCNGPTLAQ